MWEKEKKKVDIRNRLQEAFPGKMWKQPPWFWLLFTEGGICSLLKNQRGSSGEGLLTRELWHDCSSRIQKTVVNSITKRGILTN